VNALRAGLTAILICAVPLVLFACAPADGPAGATDTTPSDAGPKADPEGGPKAGSAAGPQISDALKDDCEQSRPSGGINEAGIPQGALAVDFTLKDTEGRDHTLSAMLAQKPVMMVFGSFT
jgi:hypothetical protein